MSDTGLKFAAELLFIILNRKYLRFRWEVADAADTNMSLIQLLMWLYNDPNRNTETEHMLYDCIKAQYASMTLG